MLAALASALEFDLDGVSYRWDGWRWRPIEGREQPPKDVLRRLNHRRMQAERHAEHDLVDVPSLVGLAIRARQSDAPSRAERFAPLDKEAEDYRSWAEAMGEDVMIARAFGERLLARGLERKHRNDGEWWAGIGVKSEVK